MIRRWHPSIDDPRPHFPRHCPVCGGAMDVYHLPVNEVWVWYAICDQGHRIDRPVQPRLPLEDTHEASR